MFVKNNEPKFRPWNRWDLTLSVGLQKTIIRNLMAGELVEFPKN